MAVGGENVAETDTPAAATEGATDESLAAIEESEDSDPAVAAGIDPVESASVVTEDEPTDNTLTVEDETAFTDNGSVADTQEARDENTDAVEHQA